MRRLRISAISFLNTAPLMWDFEQGAAARALAQEFEISYTVPSLCADALRRGEADIGIIPAIACQTIPDLVVIPEVAIAARGEVRSILLVSKVPLAQIKSVAADTSSRTSVALLEILFRKGWIAPGPSQIPTLTPFEPDLQRMLAAHDAALLIGDSALRVERARYQVVDLAQAWQRATGKPFVFAFWAVRKAALAEFGQAQRLATIFQQSRDHGLGHVAEIAQQWAPRVGLAQSAVRTYLTENICYSLDPSARSGLEEFFALARQFGLIPVWRELELAGGSRAAKRPR